MTDYEKRCLDELDAKADYLLARQDEQDVQMKHMIARLVFLETRLHRLMQELDIDPELIESLQTIKNDARAINMAQIPFQQLN
ncbi:hypothetical protein [Spirosoma luteum]|uniref:hypothetical protein n=1 Tax=Spirosoma luteum TaxID=431553 RepID=UPI00037AC35A|nr:hypothetical protein [Spirosoma luteum]